MIANFARLLFHPERVASSNRERNRDAKLLPLYTRSQLSAGEKALSFGSFAFQTQDTRLLGTIFFFSFKYHVWIDLQPF